MFWPHDLTLPLPLSRGFSAVFHLRSAYPNDDIPNDEGDSWGKKTTPAVFLKSHIHAKPSPILPLYPPSDVRNNNGNYVGQEF